MNNLKSGRYALIAVTVFSSGLLISQRGVSADKAKPKPAVAKSTVEHAHDGHYSMYMACAKACADCQLMCDSCSAHCAHQVADGNKDHLTTLGTCSDCAIICSSAAQIVARGGPFSMQICTACAEACEKCAEACEKFPDDEHMKKCAEECRKCEKACKDMLEHGAHN